MLPLIIFYVHYLPLCYALMGTLDILIRLKGPGHIMILVMIKANHSLQWLFTLKVWCNIGHELVSVSSW